MHDQQIFNKSCFEREAFKALQNCPNHDFVGIIVAVVQSTQSTAIAEHGIGDRKQQLNYTSYAPELLA